MRRLGRLTRHAHEGATRRFPRRAAVAGWLVLFGMAVLLALASCAAGQQAHT